ncbi:MAG: hypothetical protein AAF358_08865 [Pseudomonadota bacterium]
MSQPEEYLPFIMTGTASEPTYDDNALAAYHPPTNADDRVGYTTETVLGFDRNQWYARLLLTGRWHQEAKRLTSNLRFFRQSATELLANDIDNQGVFADNWNLVEYRLRLPNSNTDPDDIVMVGELTWIRDGVRKNTRWYWKE